MEVEDFDFVVVVDANFEHLGDAEFLLMVAVVEVVEMKVKSSKFLLGDYYCYCYCCCKIHVAKQNYCDGGDDDDDDDDEGNYHYYYCYWSSSSSSIVVEVDEVAVVVEAGTRSCVGCEDCSSCCCVLDFDVD